MTGAGARVVLGLAVLNPHPVVPLGYPNRHRVGGCRCQSWRNIGMRRAARRSGAPDMKIHFGKTRDVWVLLPLLAPVMTDRNPLMNMKRRLKQMPVVSHRRQNRCERTQ